jgi:hypothetical protein
MTHREIAAFALISTGVAFIASLGFPVFYGTNRSTIYGIECLLFGWLACAYPSWFANVLLLTWAISLGARRYRIAFVMSALAVPLALTSLTVTDFPTDMAGGKQVLGYGAGFFLWLAAMGLAVVSSIFLFYKRFVNFE